jgi:hypothetical protein
MRATEIRDRAKVFGVLRGRNAVEQVLARVLARPYAKTRRLRHVARLALPT